MKKATVTTLKDYKAQRLLRTLKAANAGLVALPDAGHLGELLDRNISLQIWKGTRQ